jgi:predicted nuclease of predicted toxin-antitoxin system
MPRMISLEAFEMEVEDDPTARDAGSEPPRVRRKVPILLDENLADPEVVQMLGRKKKNLKVRTVPAGTPDEQVWAQAKSLRAVVLTADRHDFWDDRKYQLQDCPGLVVLTGKTTRDHLQALSHALEKSPLLDDRQRYGTSRDMKIKASPAGAVQVKRFIQGVNTFQNL